MPLISLQTSIAKAGGWQALHTAIDAAIETTRQSNETTRAVAGAAGTVPQPAC